MSLKTRTTSIIYFAMTIIITIFNLKIRLIELPQVLPRQK